MTCHKNPSPNDDIHIQDNWCLQGYSVIGLSKGHDVKRKS
jgi:hypothetical protein